MNADEGMAPRFKVDKATRRCENAVDPYLASLVESLFGFNT